MNSDAIKLCLSAETRARFSYHRPDQPGITAMAKIRAKVRELAEEIETSCPAGDLRKLAIDQLFFTMTSANAAIVQQYPIDPEKP